MLQQNPGKIHPVLAAFSIWLLTILAGSILFIIYISIENGEPLININGVSDEEYSELFSVICIFSTFYSIPAAAVYIVVFALLARADVPRYVAGSILSFLSALAVYFSIRYFMESNKDFIYTIIILYLSPLIVFTWIGIYLSYPRLVNAPDDAPET